MDDIAGSQDGVVGDLKETCVFSIKSTLNSTSDDPHQQADFVDDIVRGVEDVSCPGEPTVCSGHGTCSKRRCVCDAGISRRHHHHQSSSSSLSPPEFLEWPKATQLLLGPL